ncbi:MAG: hypothetical protein ABIP74_05315 [Candidatus Saccharimonas sp.]
MAEVVRRPQVQLESPFGAKTREGIITNVAYALIAMHDSLWRNEAPFASHLLYTQMFNDNDADERRIGIEAGLAIGEHAEFTALYEDLGISTGMQMGIAHAENIGRPIVHRRLYDASLSLDEITARIHTDSPLSLETIGAVYARIHV